LDTARDSESSADLAKALNEATKEIEQLIQEVRSLTFELSSPILYELGFETAVADWLNERIRKKHGIATEFEDDRQPKALDDDTRAVLFRDVRELLTNVVKHAQAKSVKVSIRKVGSRIHVSVEDDGCGFDPAEIAATATKVGGFGLFSIRERLKQLEGNIEIQSAPGRGTRVTLTVPLKQ
jgi:signal transduction histidine kinase